MEFQPFRVEGWADASEIPIICIYKSGSKLAGSLIVVSDEFIEYTDSAELVNKLQKKLNELKTG